MNALESRESAAPDTSDAITLWRRLTTVGLFALPVILVATQVVNEVIIPPLIVFALAAAGLGVALLAGKGRRVLYGAVALGVISVVASAPFLIADLSHPETGAGFVLSLSAVVIGLGTAASAVFATRRRPPNKAGVVAIAAVGLLVLGTVGSVVATLGVEDDQRREGDVEVTARDTTFPDKLEVQAGPVGFFLENDDVYRHTILIQGTDVKVELPGSTARRFETELAPGAYRYYCDVPGHENMEGTLNVS